MNDVEIFKSFIQMSNHHGHPTTVFCKISVRKSKHGLEFSIGLGRLKISRSIHVEFPKLV